MIKFRTEYEAARSRLTLNPANTVVMIGSCFTQNMALKMNEHMWKAVNPFGTLYNPHSLAFALDMMADKEKGLKRFEDDLFEFNGLWNSTIFDSSFSSPRKEDCIEEFLNRQREFLDNIEEGYTIIVTFGTSICYHLRENGVPVGNCHKQPANLFYEKRMTVSEIVSYWDVVIENLKEKYQGLKIIFTVSPVRHLKNGFTGNSRSKAVLQLAIEEICMYNEGCYYFPAYEIVNDDLRDYRFYASDLTHPSDEAVEYVWGKFIETFVDETGKKLLDEGEKIYKAKNHRPKTGALGRPLS